MEVTVTDNITPALRQLAREYPEAVKGALLDLAAHFRKRLAESIRMGQVGSETLTPLNQLTIQLRQANLSSNRGRRPSGAVDGIGGALTVGGAEGNGLVESVINEKGFRVGFLGVRYPGTDRFTEKFQEPRESYPLTAHQHEALRKVLGDDFKQPTEWEDKPERNSVAPLNPEFQKTSNEILAKSIVAKVNAAKARYGR